MSVQTTPPISTSPAAPAMRCVVASGMIWMVLNLILTKGASFAAQIYLGWKLSKGDFGVYAIAISVSQLVQTFRDAGLRQILIQRYADYPRLRGPIFWMSWFFSLATSLILLGIAPVVAGAKDLPVLSPMLWVIAAVAAIATPGEMYNAKLMAQLQFRKATHISAASALLRQASTIAFAAAGFGPLSFVLPMLVTTLFDGTAGFIATRDKPWTAKPNLAKWPELLANVKWIFGGTLASSLIVSGDYLAIGCIQSEEIVGLYYFAYQLSVQTHVLFAGNLQSVLLPTLSRLQGQPARQGAAFVKSLEMLALFTFPVTLCLALCAQPLEQIIWHGRWTDAIPVIQILCLTLSWRSITAAAKSVLESQGAFRTYVFVGGLDGLGNLLAGAIGACLGGVQTIAIVICIYSAASGLGQGLYIAKRLGFSYAQLLKGQAIPWTLALLATGATWLLTTQVFPPMSSISTLIARTLVFGSLYAAGVWLLLPHLINELKAILPHRRSQT